MFVDMRNHPANQTKVRCFGSKAGLTAEATVLLKDGEEPLAALNLEVAPRDGECINWLWSLGNGAAQEAVWGGR